MWRLWNKLFGWDYVHWRSKYSHIEETSRVIVDKTGKLYVKWFAIGYKSFDDFDRVVWLTCKPEKYLGEINNERHRTLVEGTE